MADWGPAARFADNGTEPARLPSGPKTWSVRASRFCRFVQPIDRPSFDPSPFGENDRAATAAGLVPVLAAGLEAAPKVTPPIVAPTVVLLGAGMATRFALPLPLAATQASVRT